MLAQFRSLAHSFFAKLLLALLVLSFAVWGVEDMVRGGGSAQSVAKIGKTSVSIEAYQRAVQREADNIRRMLGENYSPEMVKMLQPEKRALQSLIQKTLLERESLALGIVPGDEEVARRIHSNPGFQDGKGRFDKERYLHLLKNARITEKSYVDGLRQDIALSLLMDTFSVDSPIPDIAVETAYRVQEEQRKITLYTVNASYISVVSPSADTLEKYYSLHGEEYNVPEYRVVSYVKLNPEDAKTTAAITENDLKAAYNERQEEFRRPERREVDQLLFKNKEDAEKAHSELSSGKDFDAVAKSSPILNKGTTALGKIERERVLEGAADAVFLASKGGITPPVQSLFGWHVFRVRGIESSSIAPLSEVRTTLEKDLKDKMLEDAQSNFLNRFEDTLAGGATLQDAAKEFGLKLETFGPTSQDGKSPEGKTLPLPNLDKFLEIAFKTEDKAESSLVNTQGGAYYVLRVDKLIPERPRVLSEIKAEVIGEWQKEERAARLKELADTTAKALQEKKPAQAKVAFTGAIKRNSSKAGALQLVPELVNDVFSRSSGSATNAYLLPSGDYAIAVAGERIPAGPMNKEAAAATRAQLQQAAQNELAYAYLKHLENKHPVWVNEPLLQSMHAESSDR
jgi:peptidyl-prolyl cis-trans isomerase D